MSSELTAREKLIASVAHAKLFLNKEYLQYIDKAKLVGVTPAGKPSDALRLIHIDTLLYDRQECVSEKLKALFGAVENYGESVVLMINGKRGRAEIYMGVACEQPLQPVFDTFLRSLNSLMPGCQYKILHNSAICSLMDDVLPPAESVHISTVSPFPTEMQERDEAPQKLDVLIEGMKHTPFSMILLAQAMRPDELSAMQQHLEKLYTDLSLLERATFTYSQSNSKSIGESLSKSISESVGYNANISRGHSTTVGTGTSTQRPNGGEKDEQRSALTLLGTAAAMLIGMSGGNKSGDGKNGGGQIPLLQSLFYGSSIANILSSSVQLLGIGPETQPIVTDTAHEDHQESENTQEGTNKGHSESQQEGSSTNVSDTYGRTRQVTQVNKLIADLLEMLDDQIKQISAFQREGAFHTAAYFVAGDSETAVSAANMYRSLCTSACLPTLRPPICHWDGISDVTIIRNYLSHGQHPVFRFPSATLGDRSFPDVQLAQLVGLSDMPRYFALPEHTVPGMVVSNSASFARDVVSTGSAGGETDKKMIPIGCIYHMGKEDRHAAVRLNMDDLTKHLFVSGATGVGKSNFCYHLLDELDKRGIRILVIEPAKGEYRHVLGGREGFSVYGVDPNTGPVLRINPFAYPDGIPTIQHIDRLLDIFNTAWPMYSAMPAILKESVELIYTEKGFDLLGGSRPAGVNFPSVRDLLEALPRVIKQSSYSNEVKGNYEGALLTRVRSLTNGLYGIVFSEDEIGDEALFHQNVIVDISRIGSAETKALLMGVLTARLIEHRMAEGKINSPLRHVTVLEEAHNLLRRHNPSSDGSSARAASVEMLASAIAEMRSSGEGFIIADQSPSVMDMSVIRNTQTKVFFMLPDREDRLIVGNSLSLNDGQQQEIARLRPGVAAVYQNGWTDAVLCKIEYFDKSRERPFILTQVNGNIDHRMLLGQTVALLLTKRLSGESSLDEEKVEVCLKYEPSLLPPDERYAQRILREWREKGLQLTDQMEMYKQLCRVLPLEQLLKSCTQLSDAAQWIEHAESAVAHRAELTKDELHCLITFGLHRWSRSDPAAKRPYIRYLEHTLASKGA